MISTFLGGIIASPWMRAALRYGAIAFTIMLFLHSIRCVGERTGRPAKCLKATERTK